MSLASEFVTGVMSLIWVAIIFGFILVEKVARRGRWVSYASAPVLAGLAALSFAGGLS